MVVEVFFALRCGFVGVGCFCGLSFIMLGRLGVFLVVGFDGELTAF